MQETCKRIATLAMQLNPVELATPTNARKEKDAIVKVLDNGFKVNPTFKYNRNKLRQAVRVGEQLGDLKAKFLELAQHYPATNFDDPAQEQAVKNIIIDRINDAIITTEMAQAILDGNDIAMAALSAEKYGTPSSVIMGYAYDIANDGYPNNCSPYLDADVAKALKAQEFDAAGILHYFERVLEMYGITDWLVIVDDQATVIDVRGKNSSGRPLVVIPSTRQVDGLKLLELIGHEIECHLRSSENARNFWSEILTDDYLPLVPLLAKSDNEFIYEGYAKQNDTKVRGSAGLPTPNYLVAMDQARRGSSFAETMETVAGFEIQRGATRKQAFSRAWTATYRVFRGCSNCANGKDVCYSFTKDFAYFGGLHTVNESDYLDFSSMSMRDIVKLVEAGVPLNARYEHRWLCLNPWEIGLL